MTLRSEFLLLLGLISLCLAAPQSYFGSDNASALKSLLEKKQDATGSFGSLRDTYLAVSAFAKLGYEIPSKKSVCNAVSSGLSSKFVEDIFYTVSAMSACGCSEKASASTTNVITNALESDELEEMYYGVAAATTLLPSHIDIDASELLPVVASIKALADKEKEKGNFFASDDATESSSFFGGLAFETLALLAPFVDNIGNELADYQSLAENLLGRANKNGAYADHDASRSQLLVTSTVLSGVVDFLNAINAKSYKASAKLTDKLSTFVSSQSSSATLSVSGAASFITSLTALESDYFRKAIVVTLLNNVVRAAKDQDQSGVVKFFVSDMRGNAIDGAGLTLVKAINAGKEKQAPLVSNSPLESEGKGVFSFNFISARPEPGAYKLEIKVNPTSETYQFQGTITHVVRVLASATVTDVSVAVGRTSSISKASKIEVEYPKILKKKVTVEEGRHFFLSFKLKNPVSGRSIAPHQVVAQFTSNAGSRTTFIIPQVSSGYALHIDTTKVGLPTGDYTVDIIVGDYYIDNSFQWTLGDVTLNTPYTITTEDSTKLTNNVLPEIHHIFRSEEKLPSMFLSNIFSGIVAFPFLVFIGGLFRAGGNFSNFPGGATSLSGLLFVGGWGLMLASIFYYWLTLTLFPALILISVIGLPTAYFGNNVLSYYASQTTPQQKVKTN